LLPLFEIKVEILSMLNFTEISDVSSKKVDLDVFTAHQLDLVLLKNTIKIPSSTIEKEIFDLSIAFTASRLMLPDGFFLPLPYSTVNERFNKEEEALDQYFNHAHVAINQFISKQINWFEWFENQLKTLFSTHVKLLTFNGNSFSPFGVRVLTAEKNGLDIHCENAFLHQLKPSFREWLTSQVDVENACSFFIALQVPQVGGELVVYDTDWNSFSLLLDSTSYDERHDLNGSIFRDRNHPNVKSTIFEMSSGDAVIFRAAQLWHAITPPKGQINRITIGCFIAKGKDGKYYYWA